MNQLFRDLKEIVNKNWSDGQKRTQIIFYYAGHGVMNVDTEMLLNTSNEKKVRFQLELRIRLLGQMPGAYTVGIFDGCREDFRKIDQKDKELKAAGNIGFRSRGTD